MHSVRTLVEHGAERIELVVDSENATGAERLYESVGFGVTSMKRRYQLAQDGIIRLATLDAC
jgi:ribosomal protein S18 acetylase RimI-like enzyme